MPVPEGQRSVWRVERPRPRWVARRARDLGRCTEERGVFFCTNEQGADVGVIWGVPGAIGLVFVKDSARNEAAGAHTSPSEYRPLRWLDGLPEELTELGRVLASFMHDLSTAGFWLARGGASWRSTGSSIDTHDWFNLLDGPRGPLQGLEELSLDATHGELAVALAMRSLSAPTELSLSELGTLRTLPTAWAADDYPREAFEPTPEALDALRVQLARIDVLLKI